MSLARRARCGRADCLAARLTDDAARRSTALAGTIGPLETINDLMALVA